MRRTFVLPAVVALSAVLAACGSQPATTAPAQDSQTPSLPNTAPADPTPFRVYSDDDRIVLFAASTQVDGKTFDDGKLWVKFKNTGKTRLVTDHAAFGRQSYVQGAVASPDGTYAYALVSIPTSDGQNDTLYRVNLETQETASLGNISRFGLSELNARTLTISPNGRALTFRASRPATVPASATETGRDEIYDTPGVYELSLPQANAAAAQVSKQNLRLVKPDGGEGLLPRFENGQLIVVQARVPAREENPALTAQTYAYNLRFPLANYAYYVTQGYGQGDHVQTYSGVTLNDQYALDFSRAGDTDCGLPVVAATDGRVTTSQDGTTGYGNRIWITHDVTGANLNAKTLYAHLQSRAVQVGATVTRGQTIGYVGTTGNSTNCHLHFAYHNATTDAGIQPATSLKPMEGVGPVDSESATTSATCPINSFASASVSTWYRGRNC